MSKNMIDIGNKITKEDSIAISDAINSVLITLSETKTSDIIGCKALDVLMSKLAGAPENVTVTNCSFTDNSEKEI